MGKVIRNGVNYTTMEQEGVRQFVDYDALIHYNDKVMEKIDALKVEISLLRKEFEEYKSQNDGIIKDEGYYYPFGEV